MRFSPPGKSTSFLATAVLGIASSLLLTACNQPTPAVTTAMEPQAGQVCELDGMTLTDFPGPKGQIRYANGNVSYFCDTVELLSVMLAPEQASKISGAYTQDMARMDWDQPKGHWIPAQDAFYVKGSRRVGSMGPTLASFSSRSEADAFVAKFGGTVLSFSEITPDQVDLNGGITHDHAM